MKFRLAPAVILISLLPLPAAAQSTEIAVWATGSRVSDTTDAGARVKFDTGHGLAASVSRYWGDHVATEVSYSTTDGDGTLSLGNQSIDAGKLKLKMLIATAQWHFARKAMLDPYAGIGFVDVQAGDLKSDDLAAAGVDRVTLASDSGWAANAGVNVNLVRHWGIGIDGKYFRYRPRTTSEGVETGKLDLNPVVVAVGVRFRF